MRGVVWYLVGGEGVLSWSLLREEVADALK